MQNRLSYSSQTPIFPIFPEFCSLLLVSYFSKKFAGKIGTALQLIFINFIPINTVSCSTNQYIMNDPSLIMHIVDGGATHLAGKQFLMTGDRPNPSSEDWALSFTNTTRRALNTSGIIFQGVVIAFNVWCNKFLSLRYSIRHFINSYAITFMVSWVNEI